jgi:hypothetical protein
MRNAAPGVDGITATLASLHWMIFVSNPCVKENRVSSAAPDVKGKRHDISANQQTKVWVLE